jgi:carbon storage regulator
MLVLTRRVGEKIVIADDIRVSICAIRGNTVRLGISAPVSVGVLRGELADALALSRDGTPDEAVSKTTEDN